MREALPKLGVSPGPACPTAGACQRAWAGAGWKVHLPGTCGGHNSTAAGLPNYTTRAGWLRMLSSPFLAGKGPQLPNLGPHLQVFKELDEWQVAVLLFGQQEPAVAQAGGRVLPLTGLPVLGAAQPAGRVRVRGRGLELGVPVAGLQRRLHQPRVSLQVQGTVAFGVQSWLRGSSEAAVVMKMHAGALEWHGCSCRRGLVEMQERERAGFPAESPQAPAWSVITLPDGILWAPEEHAACMQSTACMESSLPMQLLTPDLPRRAEPWSAAPGPAGMTDSTGLTCAKALLRIWGVLGVLRGCPAGSSGPAGSQSCAQPAPSAWNTKIGKRHASECSGKASSRGGAPRHADRLARHRQVWGCAGTLLPPASPASEGKAPCEPGQSAEPTAAQEPPQVTLTAHLALQSSRSWAAEQAPGRTAGPVISGPSVQIKCHTLNLSILVIRDAAASGHLQAGGDALLLCQQPDVSILVIRDPAASGHLQAGGEAIMQQLRSPAGWWTCPSSFRSPAGWWRCHRGGLAGQLHGGGSHCPGSAPSQVPPGGSLCCPAPGPPGGSWGPPGGSWGSPSWGWWEPAWGWPSHGWPCGLQPAAPGPSCGTPCRSLQSVARKGKAGFGFRHPAGLLVAWLRPQKELCFGLDRGWGMVVKTPTRIPLHFTLHCMQAADSMQPSEFRLQGKGTGTSRELLCTGLLLLACAPMWLLRSTHKARETLQQLPCPRSTGQHALHRRWQPRHCQSASCRISALIQHRPVGGSMGAVGPAGPIQALVLPVGAEAWASRGQRGVPRGNRGAPHGAGGPSQGAAEAPGLWMPAVGGQQRAVWLCMGVRSSSRICPPAGQRPVSSAHVLASRLSLSWLTLGRTAESVMRSSCSHSPVG